MRVRIAMKYGTFEGGREVEAKGRRDGRWRKRDTFKRYVFVDGWRRTAAVAADGDCSAISQRERTLLESYY